MSSIQQQEDQVILGHLIEADSRIGVECKIEAKLKPSPPFGQSNAKGVMREVEGLNDVPDIALSTARARRTQFQK